MSAVPADLKIASPWRTALPAIVAVWLVIGLVFRDTALAMVEIWDRNPTFAHAWLVPPIALWLIWRQRARVAVLEPRPMPLVLLPLLGVAVLWLLADLVAVNAAAQFAFVAMLVLAVPAVLGRAVAQALLFPLLFLFFAVPFGEFMLPPMMDWTADFVVLALQVIGIPVYREGLFFVIPSGSWSVIDECSGVRYLIASFMVGSLFAYLNYRSYKRRAVFMLVSLAVPVVANWLRALIIVMMGHLSDNKLATGVDHLLYGWVFFGIVIFIMFMIGMRWAEPDEAAPAAAAPTSGGAAAAAGRGTAFAAAAVLVVALLPQLALWGLQRAEGDVAQVRLELPAQAGGWSLGERPPLAWSPAWTNPSLTVHQGYADGRGGEVGIYVAYYRGQTPDRKLVSSVNAVVGINERQWNPVGGGGVEAGTVWRATEILGPADSSATERPHVVAWRVYWIDGRWVDGDVPAKLANAIARLQGRGDDGAAVVVYARAADFATARQRLHSFTADALGPLGQALQRTRDER